MLSPHMDHNALMQRAINLAFYGLGHTGANPLVGCVIYKNGQIIGEGWHKYFGQAHAEVHAITDAQNNGFSAQGSEVFVTLEPCAHHGKTPPCVDTLIQNKVHAVHILFRDPNPLVRGKSIQKLQKSGILVYEKFSELHQENADLYELFFHFILRKLPFVGIKMAQDALGNITAKKGIQTKITGLAAQKFTHFLRQKYQAILIGAETVQVDNPHLGVRYGNFYQGKKDPCRIIFDPHVRTDTAAQVYRDTNFYICVLPENFFKAIKKFPKEQILALPTLSSEKFDLKKFLQILGEKQISSILVEGGAKTANEFFAQQCVQKYYLLQSDTIISPNIVFPRVDTDFYQHLQLQYRRELENRKTLLSVYNFHP